MFIVGKSPLTLSLSPMGRGDPRTRASIGKGRASLSPHGRETFKRPLPSGRGLGEGGLAAGTGLRAAR
jgi:hypothetical protein